MRGGNHLIVIHFFIGSSAGSPVISGGESGGSEEAIDNAKNCEIAGDIAGDNAYNCED